MRNNYYDDITEKETVTIDFAFKVNEPDEYNRVVLYSQFMQGIEQYSHMNNGKLIPVVYVDPFTQYITQIGELVDHTSKSAVVKLNKNEIEKAGLLFNFADCELCLEVHDDTYNQNKSSENTFTTIIKCDRIRKLRIRCKCEKDNAIHKRKDLVQICTVNSQKDKTNNLFQIKNDDEYVKVRYHLEECPTLIPIEFNPKGDFVDLRAAEDVHLKPGEFRLISLGVSMKLPEGYYAELVPRSSTFKNFGILQTNSIGIIDESYCGDNDIWKMPVWATRETDIRINDRIAQFRIVKKTPFSIITVDKLEDENRGGFGSTGVK